MVASCQLKNANSYPSSSYIVLMPMHLMQNYYINTFQLLKNLCHLTVSITDLTVLLEYISLQSMSPTMLSVL